MHLELAIAGLGGQGALTAGQLIAVAGMSHGKHVSNTPIYTPEVRGGSSNALVVVSDNPVGSMMVAEPNAVIFLCDLSIPRILPTIEPGAAVVVNTTLVAPELVKERAGDCRLAMLPVTDMAAELGDARIANMVAAGALSALDPDLPLEWLMEAMPGLLGERRMRFLDLNRAALEAGAKAGLASVGA
jgi:2-oxoglutarate ferredoxin oxidoreductase subunit gamma